MRSYDAARSLYSFLGFLAWCVVGIGAIVALSSFASMAGPGARAPSGMQIFMTLFPGITVALLGVYGLAMVQNGRTSVDCAEYAQQSLDVSRKHLELSKQMLEQNRESAVSYAQLLRSHPAANEEKAADSAGPSYGDRPVEAVDKVAEAPGSDVLAAPTAPALTASRTDALPNPAREITYLDGRFHIGDEAFVSKGAARKRLEELVASDR